MRKLTLVGLVFASGYACTGTDEAIGEPDSTHGIQTFAQISDAPACTPALKGIVFYVKADDQLIYCDGGKYRALDFQGTPGADGVGWLVTTVDAGAACPNGGVVVLTGPDANGDNVIDEIASSNAICDGAPGPQGEPGTPGADGSDGAPGSTGPAGNSVAIRLTTFDTSAQCAAGGTLVETGIDANGSGTLEDEEVTSSAEICNGAPGEAGGGACLNQATLCAGQCGSIPNGCGVTYNCGGCATGEVCNANQCETCISIPQATACLGRSCGTATDGCGNTYTCGPQCPEPPQTCFVAGTPVTMADGSTRAIETISVGEEVLAFDTTTGETRARRVTHTFQHRPSENLAGFVLVNGSLRATGNHPFYVNGTWIRADRLGVGDQLLRLDWRSGPEASMASIQTLETFSDELPTFNIEVDVDHNYFAGGVLVHNAKPSGDP